LQKDRHERTDGNLGLLATVIHQEVVLGPIGLDAVAQYLLVKFAPPEPSAFNNSYDNRIKSMWLRTRGNFSTLSRIIEDMRENPRWDVFTTNPIPMLLANSVGLLWETIDMADQID
jgi:hypothetical protein